MTEDFERPDWVQQMEPVLETVNEGAKDATIMVRHIRVASIKMIATECAKPKNQ